MAGNAPDGLADDFFEQILTGPSYPAAPGDTVFIGGGEDNLGGGGPMGLRLGSGSRGGGADDGSDQVAVGGGRYSGLGSISMGMPLGLNLEQAFLKPEDASGTGNSSAIAEREGSVHPTNLFPVFGQPEASLARLPAAMPVPAAARAQPPLHSYHNQTTPGGAAVVPHQPAVRPRVRARRGQATDPHSIAERLRRERIAERMKILQELVPSANKTDRATMLDDIVDYVKFLRLQVKVLSMSRLGGAGAVAQLVADVPLSSSMEGEGGEGGNSQHAWDKWSADGTEQQVAKLMEEDVGAAMQFLQSKKLCIMPISLATAIFPGAVHQPLDMPPTLVKPESNASP